MISKAIKIPLVIRKVRILIINEVIYGVDTSTFLMGASEM